MTTQITFGDAIADPALLGATFANYDPASWVMWIVVIKAVLGEALNRHERRLLLKVIGSRKPPRRAVRELWAVVGRRAGKSRMAATLAVFLAVFIDHSSKLSPGEVGTVAIIAVDRQQAAIIISYIAAVFEASGVLAQQVVRQTANDIELRSHGVTIVISVHTNSFRSIRGRTLLACIFEELAFWRDEQSANPDVETYRAVLPGLATTGGIVVGISSPYRRAGLLYQKFKKHFGQDDDDVLVVQGASCMFNKTLPKSVVDAAYRDDPIAAGSEYGGVFRSDIAGYLDAELLASLVRLSPRELPPREGITYKAFTDASGGRGDAFTLAMGHREGEVAVIDLVRATRPAFNPSDIVKDYAGILRDYGIRRVVGDAYSAEWVVAAFRDFGIVYETSKPTASDIYREALPLFTRGILELPDDACLLTELASLERRAGPSGRESITHPPGAHDDMANAVCGVAHLVACGPRRNLDVRRLSAVAPPLKSSNPDWGTPDYIPGPAPQYANVIIPGAGRSAHDDHDGLIDHRDMEAAF